MTYQPNFFQCSFHFFRLLRREIRVIHMQLLLTYDLIFSYAVYEMHFGHATFFVFILRYTYFVN